MFHRLCWIWFINLYLFFLNQDLPQRKSDINEELLAVPYVPADYEDLSEYRFQKFAATYFQSNATHQYSRKPLKTSLLLLQTQGDQLVKKNSRNFFITSDITLWLLLFLRLHWLFGWLFYDSWATCPNPNTILPIETTLPLCHVFPPPSAAISSAPRIFKKLKSWTWNL